MTASIALFDCPHCIDEYAFDWQRIRSLATGWRVRVSCPGCGNVIEVVMQAYTLIHNCDPEKYKWGEIVEIVSPDKKAPPGLNFNLHTAIGRRKPG